MNTEEKIVFSWCFPPLPEMMMQAMYTEVLEDTFIVGALSSLACSRRVKCGKLAACFTSAFAGMLWSGQRASNQNDKSPGIMPSKSLSTYYCTCSGQCHALLLASTLANVMLCKHWKILDEMHGKHSLEFERGALSAWNLKACMTQSIVNVFPTLGIL